MGALAVLTSCSRCISALHMHDVTVVGVTAGFAQRGEDEWGAQDIV